MIIPIGHDQGIQRMPWVTIGIIAACTLIQAYVSFVASDSEVFLLRLGYITDSGLGIDLISSAFVHIGWLHLIGNMLFLFLAGSALENRWGPALFLVFYLFGAAVATLVFDALHQGDPSLLLGASGAVAAAMGAFLICFTRAKIKLWYWLFRSTGTFEMSAYFALPLWLAEQVLMGSLAGGGGVAYNAHIGGFAFGAAVALGVRILRPAAATAERDVVLASPPRPSARDVRALPASAPRIESDPFRALPQPPPIVVAPRATTAEAPIVHDASAEGPKLLR